MSIPYLYWILILTSLIVSPASIGIFISFGGVSTSSVASPEIVLGAQSFTSMMTDFSQDINGVSSFVSCIYRIFPSRNTSFKDISSTLTQMRIVTDTNILFRVM